MINQPPSIYFQDSLGPKIVRTVLSSIDLSYLTGDIGGQLGLFLGASFITLAEVLSYFGKKIDMWIHRGINKHRGKTQRGLECVRNEVSLKTVNTDNGNQATLLSQV